MEKTFCVYMHTNKINGKKYIGQTCQKPETRWGIGGKKYKTSTHFWSAIQKYGWDNFEHDVLYENLSSQEANDKEKELIEKYNTTDMNFGYNLEYGGKNGLHSEETKMKISNSNKGKSKNVGKDNWNYGGNFSAEAKRKMSEAKKGVFDGAKNPSSRMVLQYDLQGNFIKEWDYIALASKTLKICTKSIGKCCRGKLKKSRRLYLEIQGGK